MIANMLKSLITHGRIETTLAKAKELQRHADKIITLAKKDTLASKRVASAQLMVRYNSLTSKEARLAKTGNLSAYNDDRKVLNILFGELITRFVDRQGGYTRIIKKGNRAGDNAPLGYLEYLS
jgi:large subunit ribosomal protein L17